MSPSKRSLLAVAVAIALPLALAATASAAATTTTTNSAAKGSPAFCKKHPKSPRCQGSGSGSGSGSGGSSISVTVAPTLLETGQSEIYAVVEVGANPAFAGDPVVVSSTQLANTCGGAVLFGSPQAGAVYGADSVQVVLDGDGNATVTVYGIDCAPGPDLVEADLVVAPYVSATTTLNVVPPSVTTPGVGASPDPEVETGNTPASGDSDVAVVITVETDPVYAEQTAEVSSMELADRCLKGGTWVSNQGSFPSSTTATATIDDDGNASFFFTGSSCAAGPSDVTADILAGVHSSYLTTFTIEAPAPSI
jgi:hypothetical protein